MICAPPKDTILMTTLSHPRSYDFTDMTSDMQAKEKKQMTLMEICDFMSGAAREKLFALPFLLPCFFGNSLQLSKLIPPACFCLFAVPSKPSPFANESVISTLVEMVWLNMFKPVNTVNVEPSEDDEQALDPAYAHTQVFRQHFILSYQSSPWG